MKFKGDWLVSNEGSIPETYHRDRVHGGRGKYGLGRNDEKLDKDVSNKESSSIGFNFGAFGYIVFFLILMLLGGVLFNGSNSLLADKVNTYTYDVGHVTYNTLGFTIDTGDSLQSLCSKKRLFKPLLNFANYWGEEFKSVASYIQLKTLVINDTDEGKIVLAKTIANFFIQLGTFISQIVVYIFYVVRMLVSFIMFIFRGYVNTIYLGGIHA